MHEPPDATLARPARAQQVPTGRPAARREAVDLLLAGRTRAALAAYRALPRAWLAEPALVQVVRQLERELRECGQQAGAPCGILMRRRRDDAVGWHAGGARARRSEVRARVLSVSVRDDDGQPLRGVAVAVDGLVAIKTGRDGTARISLSPRGSPRAQLAVSCPEGSREAAPRHVPRAVTGGTGLLELSFRCRPALRELVVVVRAPGAEGLWLRADGEPLGRVASDGTLHVLLWRAPDSEVQLLLDTGELPLSRPIRCASCAWPTAMSW